MGEEKDLKIPGLIALAALGATAMCIVSLNGIFSLGLDMYSGTISYGGVGLIATGVVAGPVVAYYAVISSKESTKAH